MSLRLAELQPIRLEQVLLARLTRWHAVHVITRPREDRVGDVENITRLCFYWPAPTLRLAIADAIPQANDGAARLLELVEASLSSLATALYVTAGGSLARLGWCSSCSGGNGAGGDNGCTGAGKGRSGASKEVSSRGQY